jgi:aminomuconate-semialdehyde/2-hydroxymuconate-6-semialdehyde dehydrogenase
VQSSFSNQGQICLCGSRIIIEERIYDKFKTEFVERVKKLSVGDPIETTTKQGAVASQQHFEKVMACIERAKSEGGTILCGGNSVTPEGRCADGYFIEPTVIENLGPECTTNREEIFGPVVTLQKFSSEAEALQLANACDYGLSASIWTQDISTANRVAAQVEAGIIWVNCWLRRDLRTAFGGIKNSGVGREGGWEALRFFTEAKNVCIEL